MAEQKDPQKELEIAISELEERVDRLRASYEQYFMGFEKIEPGVQRKDVDRRFIHLRKQQIRNTALRFRFNVVTQKFNTYSMYWTRVCRQIEEGTFKRHIAKAQRRFSGEQREGREADVSIEVELDDFDAELDLDAVLAEARATTELYARGLQRADASPAAPEPVPTPFAPPAADASVGVNARRGTAYGPEAGAVRPPRQAQLPSGAKPLLVRRRADADAPSAAQVPHATPQAIPAQPVPAQPAPGQQAPAQRIPVTVSTPNRAVPQGPGQPMPAPTSPMAGVVRPQIRPAPGHPAAGRPGLGPMPSPGAQGRGAGGAPAPAPSAPVVPSSAVRRPASSPDAAPPSPSRRPPPPVPSGPKKVP